jgi:long-chain acyl-CoA synthetase
MDSETSDEGNTTMPHANLAEMFQSVARRLGPKTALRHKQDGLYRDLSWDDYRWQVERAAAGLISLGLVAGDRVAISSENRYEWLLTDMAILHAGLVDVPLHAALVPRQIAFQLEDSGARGIIVSGQGQADKVHAVQEGLPNLQFIASFEPIEWPGAIPHYTWQGLKARGAAYLAEHPAAVRARSAALTRDALATIIYTSGTTGNPKGVMLTHGNLVSNAEGMVAASAVEPDDILLSWLPYSHIYARTCDHYAPMLGESIVALAENMDTLVRNLAEVQPTWLTAVPRFYEKVWAMVENLPAEVRQAKLPQVFGSRLKWLSSGGAALPVRIAEGFAECGLKILQGYGLTETSPVISFNRRDRYKLASVGEPLPGVEVKIAADGEILTRGPHVMKGYWQNPEATAAVMEKDGWFHTGDIGVLDQDNFLFITDRKKDLIVTAGGKNVAPAELERILTSDPHLEHAVIYGDGRPFVAAILVPQPQMLQTLAKELGCAIDVDDEWVTTPALHKFFAQRVEQLMQAVSKPERVKKFLILARPLAIEKDELTPKLSVRRKAIIARYEKQLAALYAGEDAQLLTP